MTNKNKQLKKNKFSDKYEVSFSQNTTKKKSFFSLQRVAGLK